MDRPGRLEEFDRTPFNVRFEELDTGKSWGISWDGRAMARLGTAPWRFNLRVRATSEVLREVLASGDPFVAAQFAVKGEIKISGASEDRMNRMTDLIFGILQASKEADEEDGISWMQ